MSNLQVASTLWARSTRVVARSCLTCHSFTASAGPALEALYVIAERALGGAGVKRLASAFSVMYSLVKARCRCCPQAVALLSHLHLGV